MPNKSVGNFRQYKALQPVKQCLPNVNPASTNVPNLRGTCESDVHKRQMTKPGRDKNRIDYGMQRDVPKRQRTKPVRDCEKSEIEWLQDVHKRQKTKSVRDKNKIDYGMLQDVPKRQRMKPTTDGDKSVNESEPSVLLHGCTMLGDSFQPRTWMKT